MLLKLVITYFCLCSICVGKWKLNSTGTRPIEGLTMACDPKVLSMGTILFSPSRREYRICETKGGAIKGLRGDIFLASHSEAKERGIHEEEWEIVGRDFELPEGEPERRISHD